MDILIGNKERQNKGEFVLLFLLNQGENKFEASYRMATRGRKSKYETYVQPRLKEIEGWIANDTPDEQIAKNLGIHIATLYIYREQFRELNDCYTRARARIVESVKSALLKKALGFEYEEERRIGKKDKNGENIITVEKYKRYCPPSETAAAMLLRNYDETWSDSDNATAKLKKQAQDLKQAIAETNFDLIDMETEK